MSQSPSPRHTYPRRDIPRVVYNDTWEPSDSESEQSTIINSELEGFIVGDSEGEEAVEGEGSSTSSSSSSSPKSSPSPSHKRQPQPSPPTCTSTSPDSDSEDEIISMAGKRTQRAEDIGQGEDAGMRGAKRGRATKSKNDSNENKNNDAANTADAAEAAIAADAAIAAIVAAQKASRLDLHVKIMLDAITFDCSTVVVKVGLVNPRSFIVHAHLLALHSNFIATAAAAAAAEVKEAEEDEQIQVKQEDSQQTLDMKHPFPPETRGKTGEDNTSSAVTLDDVVKIEFDAFFKWIYSGTLKLSSPRSECEPTQTEKGSQLINLWVLGSKFKAPGFQNFIMDELRSVLAIIKGGFFTTNMVRTVYSVTAPFTSAEKPCALRKFTAHCVAAYRPFQQHKGDSYACSEWEKLLVDLKEVMLEVIKFGNTGGGSEAKMPWEGHMKSEYMVEELPLQERWEARKTREPHC